MSVKHRIYWGVSYIAKTEYSK